MFLDASDFGALFNGVTDDSAALQTAIDEAHLQGKTLTFPKGTAIVKSALSLRGRQIHIIGSGWETSIQAGATMAAVFDVREVSDQPFLPFSLRNFQVNGGGFATSCLDVRYRHRFMLEGMRFVNAVNGGRYRDTWLSRAVNCSFTNNAVDEWFVGSNHSSFRLGCTYEGATDAHIKIDNASLGDGNHALYFANCDVESGGPGGRGVIISRDCSVTFDTCYLGEKILATIIINEGNTVIRGGILFFGYDVDSYGIQPQGGRISVENTVISAQTHGSLSGLLYLTNAQVDAGDYGKAKFLDIIGYMPLGGSPVFNGDVLDYHSAELVFAPRLGKDYLQLNNNVTSTKSVGAGSRQNSATFTCASAPGPNAIMGAYGLLTGDSWRDGEPCYLIVVYESSKPLVCNVAVGALQAAYTLTTLPPSSRITTAIKLDPVITPGSYSVIQFFVNSPLVSDMFTIHEVFFSDSRASNRSNIPVGSLRKC